MNLPENAVDEPRIPFLTKPMSVLSTGLNGSHLASAAASKHPIQNLQQQQSDLNPHRDLAHVRRVHGSALAMMLATERTVAARQHQQLRAYRGGAGASSLYGEIVAGTDVDLQFEDYLGSPQDRPDYLGAGSAAAAAAASGSSMMTAMSVPHAILEQQLRMR
jgi:hypothetical protein